MELADYRKELDKTDAQLLELFKKRMSTVKNIAEYKKENNVVKEAFVKYISGLQPEAKINQLAGRILKLIRKVDAIPEPELLMAGSV